MLSSLIMMGLVLFLVAVLVVGIQEQENNHFFDKENTNALRGFWCLIVVLVHIPLLYQNRIQDMIGSFAYIGVTFFFMTSAYGLRLQMENNPEKVNTFWKNRLPKLLIPCAIVNLFSITLKMWTREEVQLIELVKINDWVLWLLICYFFFWMSYKFIGGGGRDYVVIALVTAFSLLVYWKKDYINGPTWCPEVMGFVWGILLYRIKNRFLGILNDKWMMKSLLLCAIACIAGIGYLKFKIIPFWGDYLLKIILGFLIISFMLAINVKVSIGNRVSNYLGSISFEVYLVHILAFNVVKKIKPDTSSGIFIFVSLILTVALASVIKKISTVITQRIRRFIT